MPVKLNLVLVRLREALIERDWIKTVSTLQTLHREHPDALKIGADVCRESFPEAAMFFDGPFLDALLETEVQPGTSAHKIWNHLCWKSEKGG